MKNIHLLGWGSLIWDQGSLKTLNKWKTTDFTLPLEFSRISSDNRLTLVIDNNGKNNNVFHKQLDYTDINSAINNIAIREKTNPKNIAYINLVHNKMRLCGLSYKYVITIINWMKKNKINAIIWTGLRENWNTKTKIKFSNKNAYIYYKNLNKKERKNAFNYIYYSLVHCSVMTDFSLYFLNKIYNFEKDILALEK